MTLDIDRVDTPYGPDLGLHHQNPDTRPVDGFGVDYMQQQMAKAVHAAMQDRIVVNSNASGKWSARTLTLQVANQAYLIVVPRQHRGNITITSYGAGVVWLSPNNMSQANDGNSVQLVAPATGSTTTRIIRTEEVIYAMATVAGTTIDVVEEFQ